MRMRIYQDAGIEPIGYAHEGDAGLDLRSAEDCSIGVGRIHKVRTGTYFEIPEGHVGLVFPRSGIGSKGLTLENCVGVIDSGYRGEVMAALRNDSETAWRVSKNDRIAQMVVMPYATCEVERVSSVDELSSTERGADGHGSTGVR